VVENEYGEGDGIFHRHDLRSAYLAGDSAATKGLRERLETVEAKLKLIAGARETVGRMTRFTLVDVEAFATEALATLREILGELKK
jgi:hypothetical protein